jgi:hypothetical protein
LHVPFVGVFTIGYQHILQETKFHVNVPAHRVVEGDGLSIFRSLDHRFVYFRDY